MCHCFADSVPTSDNIDIVCDITLNPDHGMYFANASIILDAAFTPAVLEAIDILSVVRAQIDINGGIVFGVVQEYLMLRLTVRELSLRKFPQSQGLTCYMSIKYVILFSCNAKEPSSYQYQAVASKITALASYCSQLHYTIASGQTFDP